MDAPFKIKEPKDLADYILRNCAKETYLIFDKKENLCACTRCRSEIKLSEMTEAVSHNIKVICPECGEMAKCKEYFRGRKNLTDCGRILFLTRHGRDTYGQLDEYIINYDGYTSPSVSVWPSAQYKFNSDEQIGYKRKPSGFTEERWTQMRVVKIPGVGGIFGNSKFSDTYFYDPSKVGTDLKYANMDMNRFESNIWEPYLIIRYIYGFLKYRSIELLEKAGFQNVVRDYITGNVRGYVNWRGKSLRKILRLNNGEIKEARKFNAGTNELEKYRKGKELFPGYNFENTIKLVDKISWYRWNELKVSIEQYVPFRKAVEYILTQSCTSFGDYEDYLRECNVLGMDMRDKKVLYPNKLLEAHRKTSLQIQIEKDKKMEEDFRIHERKIIPMDEPYFFNGYLIRPAENPEELYEESKILQHCVRTYVSRVASGETSILFIRKQEEPDKPLYTLELNKDRKIVQCRGLKNCGYPDDVGELIKHWEKDIVRKIV